MSPKRAVLLVLGVLVLGQFSSVHRAKKSAELANEARKQRTFSSYGSLPLSFEANQGQTDSQVNFLSRGNGYTLFLTSTEAVLALRKPADPAATDPKTEPMPTTGKFQEAKESAAGVVRMQLIGANSEPRVVGLDELPGKSNYFIGNDPKKWRTNVPRYAKVRYEEVYPGIDLVYYGKQRQLEYDLLVAPGADP